MYVIIKNIPNGLNTMDLKMLIEPIIRGSFWQKPGKLKAIKILKHATRDQNPKHSRHAIVRLCSEKWQNRLINHINKMGLLPFDQLEGNSKPITASHFVVRHHSNDNRGFTLFSDDYAQNERRQPGRFIPIAEDVYI